VDKSEIRARKKTTSMLMNRTQLNSIAARGQMASRRSGADLFSGVEGVVTAAVAVSCPGSLPTYLPGGKLMHEVAKSTGNLRISDRRGNLF